MRHESDIRPHSREENRELSRKRGSAADDFRIRGHSAIAEYSDTCNTQLRNIGRCIC